MGIEIERKFLVRDESWRNEADAGIVCVQGYLCVGPPVAVRVRIMGVSANINIKKSTLIIQRDEFEYPIPLDDAKELLAGLCDGYPVEKTRYRLPYGGYTWEIDEFAGVNAGLVVAEIELPREDAPFERPPWLGAEVSADPRYLNSSLSRHPFTHWSSNSARD
ncbi:MAG TPA: CYTH domain-containing protein [Candidatus Hydrogenedentes bacterium]|nr:CYTH domain-containing protein [Candidatus Hydrogenedentota bacterium]HOV75434.1 CYTH domain-containing protein [Candidatus Hydrogenedentota bacterium]HPC18275.1 CYTH domain-containing protein [Candidatus Hydrogenedentota bacterium]HRT22009.1 CYTH domain-containing protein [Candidatus Hydrogenedentota bacterium]HRT66704.1 CYTH domain-containing protein [Candidatus Hydrogenedentota bacterium]